MQPTVQPGDRLLIRWGTAHPGWLGRLVVLRLPPGPDGPRPLAVKRATFCEPDGWWVERDNPERGLDSWTVGAIPDAQLLAVVLGRIWPRPGRVPSAPRR